MHPHALVAAEAAESVASHAGGRAFWAMHDRLYENQTSLDMADLLAYAANAGADPSVVSNDLTNGTQLDRLTRDFRGGVRSGVSGTPAFFINGRRFDGDWTDPDALAGALREAVGDRSVTTR